MTRFATIALLTYAALMLIGGIMGYRAAGSTASLIGGFGSAIVLLGAFAVSRSRPRPGFAIASVTALLLTINFSMRVAKTGNFIPTGIFLIISVLAAIVFSWVVFRAK